ncbi:hypothetical protein fHeYen301_3 [Yersinia phage fHe-Yen3-01]|uniref:Uncharacterized protein n=1 Tax=Yersinia phage fHe-Yen3-01 TaxID=1932893 RepID=A0A1L7DQF9_9CAUD|nr:hypothetical protein HOR56_gp03 [Yersinia phage fHe-Yen3-01]APU00336.1 hypothetical protein fHeYen301_3 [Yersinia phage fHe-Yen3-01]
MSNVTRIKFLALVPKRIWDGNQPYWGGPSDMVTREVEFRTGLGPCGKYVDLLVVDRADNGDLVIRQYHADKTVTTFVYKEEDIVGRIAIEEAAPNGD